MDIMLDNTMDVGTHNTVDTNSNHKPEQSMSSSDLGWTTKYKQGLKHTIPVRCGQGPKDSLPLDTLGFINYVTFGWLTRHLWAVYKRGAQAVSHLTITTAESAEVNAIRMERLWKEELDSKGTEKASVTSVIFRSFRTRFLIGSLVNVIGTILSMANPIYVINYFLEYLTSEEVTLRRGVYYVILLSVFLVLKGLCGSFCWMLHTEAATRIKGGTQALVYKHILNIKSLGNKKVGDLVNIFSLDGQCLWDGVTNCPLLVAGALGLFISCGYSLHFLGVWALMTWVVIVGFPLFAGCLAKRSMGYRQQSVRLTDQRVGLLSELLTNMNFIKINAWEKPLGQNITDIRSKEKCILEKSVFTMSVSLGSAMLVPLFASCLTFIGYVSSGNNLSAKQAFTFVSLMNTMQISLQTIPFALKSLSDMFVSANRIKEVLLMEEMTSYSSSMSSPSVVLEMNNARMTWVNRTKQHSDSVEDCKSKRRKNKRKNKNNEGKRSRDGDDDDGDKEKLTTGNDEAVIYTGPVLKDITFTLQRGNLLGVCGQVGCGKSTLLNVILGRMHTLAGSVAVSARMAYVPQQAWITNETIRDNILFCNDYDEDRYKQVIKVCALQQDLDSLPKGDLTQVGERGTTLSGGQKQRVSLARAAYSTADLVLLDDPLSAVDVHVGKHIFEQCISDWMKGRTVVFVTHELQYLKHCDQILVMQDGRVLEKGSHQELLLVGGSYVNLLNVYRQEGMEGGRGDGEEGEEGVSRRRGGGGKEDSHGKLNSFQNSVNGKGDNQPKPSRDANHKHHASKDNELSNLMHQEVLENTVGVSILTSYVRSMGGMCVFALVLLTFAIPVAGITGANWFVAYWIDQGGGGANITINNMTVPSPLMSDNPDKRLYLTIYGCLLPAIFITMLLRSFASAKAGLKASTRIHNNSLQWILQQPVKFFLSTPVGRVINRFSTDLNEIDNRLPMHMEIFFMNVFQVVAAIAVIGYVCPWFLLGVVPIAILFWLVVTLFHACFHQLKCLDNVTRSPIVSHLGTTVQGLSAIHVYGKSRQFYQRYCKLLDINGVAVFLYYSTNRWLALRLEVISSLVILLTGLLILVTFDLLNPALAGLGLAYAIQISGLFQYTVRLAMETEARFSSVQRLQEYSDKRPEEDVEKVEKGLSAVQSSLTTTPPSDWPQKGHVSFSKVSLCYRHGMTLALKNVTFDVKAGEKIGIVGRTGAGKSSLCSALFKLYDLDQGVITIDGLDIATVDTKVLRSRMSVVPQDPVLLVGTIRSNLDPFHQHPDADLWQALGQCHADQLVKSLERQLDTTVQENGSNFSIGEKQLLCMTRVFLKHSRILVLDEATASVDSETLSLIQRTLQEAFGGCTLLVIAHRLESVLAYDRILVMEDGQAIEFDTPSNLLSQPSSKFAAMLKATECKGHDQMS